MSECRLELWRVSVIGNVNDNFDVIRSRTSFELRFCLHHDLDPRVCVTLDHRLDPDERLDLKRMNKTRQYSSVSEYDKELYKDRVRS